MGVEKLQEKKEPYSVPPVDGIKPKETDKPRQRKTESGETRIDDSDEYRQ
jgi:hypothetical protein